MTGPETRRAAAIPTALGDILITKMRPVVWAGSRCLDNGNATDAEELSSLLCPLSVHELRAALVLALECADPARTREVCGPECRACSAPLRPQTAGVLCRSCRRSGVKPPAEDVTEYAHLRSVGLAPWQAAQRACDVGDADGVSALEAAWRQQEEVA